MAETKPDSAIILMALWTKAERKLQLSSFTGPGNSWLSPNFSALTSGLSKEEAFGCPLPHQSPGFGHPTQIPLVCLLKKCFGGV